MSGNVADSDLFIKTVDDHVLKLSDVQIKQLLKYSDLILEWNPHINLISRKEIDLFDRHFLNSALMASFTKFRSRDKVLDMGSGGGFPAVILKILFPDTIFFLTDSVLKKCNFLNEVVYELKLEKIHVINSRVENLERSFRQMFDYIMGRAVGSLTDLLSWSQHYLKKDGSFLFLKGKNYQNELSECKKHFTFECQVHRYESLPFLLTPQESALLQIQNPRRKHNNS